MIYIVGLMYILAINYERFMVLWQGTYIDGSSEHGAHIWSKSIC